MSILEKKGFVYLLILGVVVFLYGNTLLNGYNLDDDIVVEGNALVQKGISSIPEILTSTYYDDGEASFGYRPIVKLSFAVESSIWGQNPMLSHLVNVVMYAFVGMLLFHVLYMFLLPQNKILSLLITIFFLAHPIHTEVVASLKSRDELFAFSFTLLSLYQFCIYATKSKVRALTLGLVFFILALMSKLSSMPNAVVIPLILFYLNIPKSRVLKILGILLVLIITYIGALVTLFGDRLTRDFVYYEVPWVDTQSISDSITYGSLSIGFYIKKLFLPHPLGFYYGFDTFPNQGVLDINVLFWGVVIILLLILAYLTFKRGNKLISLGILIFFIYISMFSNIFTPVTGIVGERHVFHASLGFSLSIVVFLFGIFKLKFKNGKIGFVLICLIFSLMSFKTIDRNFSWKDRATLFEADGGYLSKSAKAQMLMGKILFKSYVETENPDKKVELLNKSEKALRNSLEVMPQFGKPHRLLGLLLKDGHGSCEDAYPFFQNAIELGHGKADVYLGLADCLQQNGRIDEAIDNYSLSLNVIEGERNKIEPYYKLTTLTLSQGRVQEAKNHITKMKESFPDAYQTYNAEGVLRLSQADTLGAFQSFLESYQRGYAEPDIYFFMSEYYGINGDVSLSQFYLEKANSLKKK